MRQVLENQLRMLSIQILEPKKQEIIRERINENLRKAREKPNSFSRVPRKISLPSKNQRRRPILNRKQPFRENTNSRKSS